jgi:hypothetical protein
LKIAHLKATIFQRGALDLKPISVILLILLKIAGPYSGPPHHAKMNT